MKLELFPPEITLDQALEYESYNSYWGLLGSIPIVGDWFVTLRAKSIERRYRRYRKARKRIAQLIAIGKIKR